MDQGRDIGDSSSFYVLPLFHSNLGKDDIKTGSRARTKARDCPSNHDKSLPVL